MNTRSDVKPASFGFLSNEFFDVLHSTELCVLLMICSETFSRLILQLVLPRGLILGYVSILITPPDITEMFWWDESASKLNNDTLIWWLVSLFSLKSKPCLSWWGPLLRRLSPVFEAWSSLAIHPSGQEASPLQGLNPHLSFEWKQPSREAMAPFFFIITEHKVFSLNTYTDQVLVFQYL